MELSNILHEDFSFLLITHGWIFGARLQRLSHTNKDEEPLKKLVFPGMVGEMSIYITKYWCQKYQLFLGLMKALNQMKMHQILSFLGGQMED